MIQIPKEQVNAYREQVLSNGDKNLHVDVGYFLAWYSASEIGVTSLLALASKSSDLEVFDSLTSGMDLRTKVQRFRKICKNKWVIGPNLDARLTHMDDKARPIRNKLSHSFIGINDKKDNCYFAATLGKLPWNELNEKRPSGVSKIAQPDAIEAATLLGWGGWLAVFSQDLSATFRYFLQQQEFEIMHPKTKLLKEE